MIQNIADAPEGVLALRAVGKVDAADYRTVLEPAIERAVADHGKVRLVFEIGPEYEGHSVGAAWEDMKLGTGHLSAWQRCAVVTDHGGIAGAVRVFSVFMPGEVRIFPVGELDRALAWAAG
jgi:hypothetical protein